MVEASPTNGRLEHVAAMLLRHRGARHGCNGTAMLSAAARRRDRELGMESENLVDLGNYPEIYSDGIGEVHILGVNARLYLYTWQRVNGVFKKVVACTIIRPTATMCLYKGTAVKREGIPEGMVH
jgi:hypothetical protein